MCFVGIGMENLEESKDWWNAICDHIRKGNNKCNIYCKTVTKELYRAKYEAVFYFVDLVKHSTGCISKAVRWALRKLEVDEWLVEADNVSTVKRTKDGKCRMLLINWHHRGRNAHSTPQVVCGMVDQFCSMTQQRQTIKRTLALLLLILSYTDIHS